MGKKSKSKRSRDQQPNPEGGDEEPQLSAPETSEQEQLPVPTFKQKGEDSLGRKYKDLPSMWKHELSAADEDGKLKWYSKAVSYWNTQPATLEGVLGGFGFVSDADLQESAHFLLPFLLGGSGRERALDCGAGIGRVTRGLILKLGYQVVDLVEPCEHMLKEAVESIPKERLGTPYQLSIQELPLEEEAKYDLIVLQWVAIYLTDDDFVKFIQKARRSLRPNGVIFIKENTSKDGFIVDKDDSSLTRTEQHYKHIIATAGGKVVKEAYQKEFPKDLFKVLMLAVQ